MAFLWRKMATSNPTVAGEHDDDAAPPFPSLASAQRATVPQIEIDSNDVEYGAQSGADKSPVTIATELSKTYMPPPSPPRRQSAVHSLSPTSTPSTGPASVVKSARAPRTSQANTTPSRSSERPLPKFNFSNVAPSGQLAVPTVTAPTTLAQARQRREKVALDPGFSQLDWATLKNSGKDLSGRPNGVPPARITLDELKRHSTHEDAWTALGGKVYNISPYLRYHPGGVKELMRCAGRDGTKLFNLTHVWVNYDRMLSNCFVGYLVPRNS
ncbi:hypothetical protein POJ06DRAFT_272774 [Lipomyces tetrasporus]|uniref:Cytochrome b5 heme-binding domain-containing protein n=1 Tax=Lipomyces tetrasporus TaxID=54092 RepID=A0AAD7QZ39_9ASCO|nr:uncharacterized protein POJ06DRAFT_272774 [Lipomyces tetrasporus]KAJ8104142.1 hypothetical protein POJ06DRAFT_272774 [Lipomyces tetrasporus]